MSLYSRRGVSAQKEEVHAAIRQLDQGLYPYAFCKLYPDLLGGDAEWVNILHADGGGTKSILAYLYWKETGDTGVWKGIAQDAIVMNLDDLLCVGICDGLLFSSTIDRNKTRIPGEVLQAIIEGSAGFFSLLREYGIRVDYLGGETADVGDLVRTIAVNGTMGARWPKNRLVTNEKIATGNVIVGLASFGRAIYEHQYNSGIASNGLTSARHDMLSGHYREHYPESFEATLSPEVTYLGPHRLTDEIRVQYRDREIATSIGGLLLSPTRTFAPAMKRILEEYFTEVNGLIHCSGGGQTKCLKYLPGSFRIVKDNLFEPPPVFELIRQASGAQAREMYQVYNMGTRLEIYTSERAAPGIIAAAGEFGIEARIIGRVEASDKKELRIHTPAGLLEY